jgi:hypothetical protein
MHSATPPLWKAKLVVPSPKITTAAATRSTLNLTIFIEPSVLNFGFFSGNPAVPFPGPVGFVSPPCNGFTFFGGFSAPAYAGLFFDSYFLAANCRCCVLYVSVTPFLLALERALPYGTNNTISLVEK